jgi:hypothetical protein
MTEARPRWKTADEAARNPRTGTYHLSLTTYNRERSEPATEARPRWKTADEAARNPRTGTYHLSLTTYNSERSER